MSLLDKLRDENPEEKARDRYQLWSSLPNILVDLVPGYTHGKMVLIRGEVIITGSVSMAGMPRHLYAVLHTTQSAQKMKENGRFPYPEGLPERPDANQLVAMGISRYRAEAEVNYYTSPWTGLIEPNSQALASWIGNILNTTMQDTPAAEKAWKERSSTH